jgi:hypothetical protein
VGELLEIPVGELGRHDPRVLEDEGV